MQGNSHPNTYVWHGNFLMKQHRGNCDFHTPGHGTNKSAVTRERAKKKKRIRKLSSKKETYKKNIWLNKIKRYKKTRKSKFNVINIYFYSLVNIV